MDNGIENAAKAQPAQTTELKPKQVIAAQLLASGKSIAETARLAKCTERTINFWNKIPAFKDRIRTFQTDLLADYKTEFQSMIANALDVYRFGLLGKQISTANKQMAADVLRTHGILRDWDQETNKQNETVDIEFGTVKPNMLTLIGKPNGNSEIAS